LKIVDFTIFKLAFQEKYGYYGFVQKEIDLYDQEGIIPLYVREFVISKLYQRLLLKGGLHGDFLPTDGGSSPRVRFKRIEHRSGDSELPPEAS